MKRAISGIKATGDMTLGNYLGAVKQWVGRQGEYDELFLFIPDLHSINIHPDPKQFPEDVKKMIAWLLAAGIDPTKTSIFIQSQISAHSELATILSNYVSMGELSRQTQFKDKTEKYGKDGIWAGFFTYPILMAADILLYDISEVPVGDDQKQHVELTRDIAERFNNKYGDVFTVPKAVFAEEATRIMDLQHPDKKMSKSDDDTKGVILLDDSTDVIIKKVMGAQTDSDNKVAYGTDKHGINNLLTIYCALQGKTKVEAEKEFSGFSYGDFKKSVSAALVDEIEPVQKLYKEFIQEESRILEVIAQGKRTVEAIANKKLQQVKDSIGLIK